MKAPHEEYVQYIKDLMELKTNTAFALACFGFDDFMNLLTWTVNGDHDGLIPVESPVDILLAYMRYRETDQEWEFDSYMTDYMDNFQRRLRGYDLSADDDQDAWDEAEAREEKDNERALQMCNMILECQESGLKNSDLFHAVRIKLNAMIVDEINRTHELEFGEVKK